MEGMDFESAPAPPRPRTITVLGLLAFVALVFSYIVAYAMVNALVSAEMMKPWPSGSDPRLKYFAFTFVGLMVTFVLFGALARFVSKRQLKKIDDIENAPETV